MFPEILPLNGPPREDVDDYGLVSRLAEEVHLRAEMRKKGDFECIIPRKSIFPRRYDVYLKDMTDSWSATLYLPGAVPLRELGTFFCVHVPSRAQNLASASERLKPELDPELRDRFNLTTEDSQEYIAFYCLVNPYVTADEILATRTIQYVVHDPSSLQGSLEDNDSLRQGLQAFSKQIKKSRRAHHSESSNAENVFGSDPGVDAATQELAELEKKGRERGWLI